VTVEKTITISINPQTSRWSWGGRSFSFCAGYISPETRWNC